MVTISEYNEVDEVMIIILEGFKETKIVINIMEDFKGTIISKINLGVHTGVLITEARIEDLEILTVTEIFSKNHFKEMTTIRGNPLIFSNSIEIPKIRTTKIINNKILIKDQLVESESKYL